jgi:hypothetical protein
LFAAYRDKKVVGVFVRFSCAASSIHFDEETGHLIGVF